MGSIRMLVSQDLLHVLSARPLQVYTGVIHVCLYITMYRHFANLLKSKYYIETYV